MSEPAPPAAEPVIRKRLIAIGAATLVPLIGLALYGVIEQDQAYHCFADQRTILGVPNAWDVLSNLVFLVTGAFGLWTIGSRRAVVTQPWETSAWSVCFFGIVATSVGSAWYHLDPTDASLAWDRLPMTIVFAAVFALMLGERVSWRLGRASLAPLLFLGLTSIAVWRGTGDLRMYAAMQFAPMLAIVLLLIFVPSRYDRSKELWIALGWYVAAKVLEAGDTMVFDLNGVVSGHTLKHLAASAAPIWFALYLTRRRPVAT